LSLRVRRSGRVLVARHKLYATDDSLTPPNYANPDVPEWIEYLDDLGSYGADGWSPLGGLCCD
jgi:hypothetical protein